MNTTRSWLKIGAIICMFIVHQTHALNIIFDLGGVLFDTCDLSACWHVGPSYFLSCLGTLKNPFTVQEKLFNFCNAIHPQRPGCLLVKDANGKELPQLVHDWLTGTPSHLVLQKIRTHLHGPHDTFSTQAERELILAVAQMMFTPETFIKTQAMIHDGIAFARECKQQGHKVFILSNHNDEIFTHIIQHHKEAFALFDGIVVSGNVGKVKPDPSVYLHALSRFNLKPQETVFIDDQAENVAAAKTCGITGILCPRSRQLLKPWQKTAHFGPVRETIKELVARV